MVFDRPSIPAPLLPIFAWMFCVLSSLVAVNVETSTTRALHNMFLHDSSPLQYACPVSDAKWHKSCANCTTSQKNKMDIAALTSGFLFTDNDARYQTKSSLISLHLYIYIYIYVLYIHIHIYDPVSIVKGPLPRSRKLPLLGAIAGDRGEWVHTLAD